MTAAADLRAQRRLASIPSRCGLVAIWLTVVVGFGAAVVAIGRTYTGLDDPNQAYQRPGFLDARPLPAHVRPVAPGVPTPGRRAVVFFVRPAQLPATLDAVSHQPSLTATATVAIVDSAPPPPRRNLIPVVADPSGALAHAYGMRAPRDGGAPVGYAVIDSSGRVRYATIDPGAATRLSEIATILRVTP